MNQSVVDYCDGFDSKCEIHPTMIPMECQFSIALA